MFLVLTGIGFVRGRRELLDPRKAVLGVLTLAVLLAIWVRASEIGNLNGRYFLLLVFLDAPFTAIGARCYYPAAGATGPRTGRRMAETWASCSPLSKIASSWPAETEASLAAPTAIAVCRPAWADGSSNRPVRFTRSSRILIPSGQPIRHATGCRTSSRSTSFTICGWTAFRPIWRSFTRTDFATSSCRIW